jgi:hypothetical protein
LPLARTGRTLTRGRTRSVGAHGIYNDLIALFEVFARNFYEGAVIETGPDDDGG